MTLEQRAREEWMNEGDAMHEMVALGFVQDDETIVWYEMANVADPQDGRGEFLVEGNELRDTLFVAEKDGHRGCPVVLWHTHVNTIEPSAEDIAEFPGWLAQIGMVYHVPSDTATLYNGAGIISNNQSDTSTLIATPQDGE